MMTTALKIRPMVCSPRVIWAMNPAVNNRTGLVKLSVNAARASVNKTNITKMPDNVMNHQVILITTCASYRKWKFKLAEEMKTCVAITVCVLAAK